MALSAVEICNRALNACGLNAITALDQGTETSELCRRLYGDLRDELIQDHPWNFATRRTALAALSTAPDWEWDYQYTMPTDCLRVLAVEDAGAGDESWTVEGRQILTNSAAPLNIRYLTRDVSEIYFPPKFTSALVLRIAMDLAMPATEGMSRREMLGKQFVAALRSARGQDSRESGPQVIGAEDIIYAGI